MFILKKKKSAGETDKLVQKQQTRATKLGFPPWNSNMLPSVGARANKIPCTKVHISSWKT